MPVSLAIRSLSLLMAGFLQSAKHGRVLRLFLNRADKRNALNAALCREIVSALEAAEQDASVGAVLLSAHGKVFCAGMDVSEIGPGMSDEIAEANERLFTVGARLTKPLIAAIQGAALGGGFGLVANCHIALASEAASFGLTEIRLGLWPFLIFRVAAQAVGERRATELALSGRIFDAAEAVALGLVHRVCTDLESESLALATTVAQYSPTAIRAGLRFVGATRERDWEAAGRIGRQVRNEVFASADFQEGVRAFQEKRPPKWPSIGDE